MVQEIFTLCLTTGISRLFQRRFRQALVVGCVYSLRHDGSKCPRVGGEPHSHGQVWEKTQIFKGRFLKGDGNFRNEVLFRRER